MSSMVQRYDVNGNEEDEIHNGIKKACCICQRTSHRMDQMFSIYAMTAIPRGVALILDFEDFDDKERFKKRNGSKCDVRRLRMLFHKFLFEVEIDCNLTRKEFESRLKSFSIDSRHSTANMMILALLSHGDTGVIYTSDGSPVSVEGIVEMFNNRNCQLLKGKPKWFIVQACRGDQIDRGCQTDRRPSIEDANRCYADANPFQAPIQSQISVQTLDSIETSPSVEDVLISWATIPGHISVRHPEDGSWFIQCLDKIFNKYATEYDLYELLQLTSKELSKQFCPEVGKQACNIDVRNFYNKLYF